MTWGSYFHLLENTWDWLTALGSMSCFSNSSLLFIPLSLTRVRPGVPRGRTARGLPASRPSLLQPLLCSVTSMIFISLPPHLHCVQKELKPRFLQEIGASSWYPHILHPYPGLDLSARSERTSLHLDFGLGWVPSLNGSDVSS